jgi:hypothetical protein
MDILFHGVATLFSNYLSNFFLDDRFNFIVSNNLLDFGLNRFGLNGFLDGRHDIYYLNIIFETTQVRILILQTLCG